MKIYYSKASPFARKALINAFEAEIIKNIELIDLSKTGQFVIPEHFKKINPLFKIPAFETDSGDVIIDSPVICEYIDSISKGRKLLSASGPERFKQLKLQALADGLLDAAVLRRYEFLREPHLKSIEFDQKQKLKIFSTLEFLNQHVSDLQNPYMIGEVAILCALGYLDFRFSAENWKSDFVRLADWYHQAESWLPFKETSPLHI